MDKEELKRGIGICLDMIDLLHGSSNFNTFCFLTMFKGIV